MVEALRPCGAESRVAAQTVFATNSLKAIRKAFETHGEPPTASGGQGGTVVQNQTAPIIRAGPRVGRNDPCPCGSGKKYKKCHLPLEEGGAASAE